MTWLMFILLAQYQPPRAGTVLPDVEQEKHAERVGKTIRCAVCQGLSVADSPAPMAQAMMDRIRDQVAAGKSDDEIREFFEQRYGEFILLKPKAQGLNWLVWLGPMAIALGGLVLIARNLRKPGSTSERKASEISDTSTGDTEADLLAQVRREVDQ